MYSARLLVLIAGLTLAFASPVSKSSREDATSHEDAGGVVAVPLDPQVYLGGGVLDDDDGGYFGYSPFGNPFAGFLQSMDAMLRNLREQMSQVLHRLPAESGEWTEIPHGKGNTTSTTKIIDGHKVTINETTYANDGDNEGSFFKIRIIDVHPTSDEDSGSDEKPAAAIPEKKPADVEEITKRPTEVYDKGSPEIEESANEIPQGKPETESLLLDGDDGDIETLAEELTTDESVRQAFFADPEELMEDQDLAYVPPLPDVETNEVDGGRPPYDLANDVDGGRPPYDLASDVDVNRMLADRGAPHDPDAELVEPVRTRYDDALTTDVFVNENHPGKDGAVADSNDAEFVEFPSPLIRDWPKYEKLSAPYANDVAAK